MEGYFLVLYRTDIRYSHEEAGRKNHRAADSYLVVRFNDGLPAIRFKPAFSRLVVEGSWSLDLE